jgi:lysophospholipase L1-like esterase/pimeloyl-ACP methyl ester carboxylesterase
MGNKKSVKKLHKFCGIFYTFQKLPILIIIKQLFNKLIKARTMKKIFLLLIAVLLSCSLYSQTKVACVGNSITFGAGIKDRSHDSYPAQLQSMLGKDYIVKNFGNSGTTLLKKGDFPYWKVKEYQEALTFNPDVVFIKLGTNDSKPQNRIYLNEFIDNYIELINSFQGLKSNPKIILLLPVPVFSKQAVWGITDTIVSDSIIPKIREVAYQKNVEVINLYNLLIDSAAMFPDKIHPDKNGAAIIAKRCFDALKIEKDKNFDIFSKLEITGTKSNYHGYECIDFTYKGNACKIAKPKFIAKGKPWIWRARFWGHEPQTDIALLERGYHLVYCDVAELFGNQVAVDRWNDFYQFLQKGGLAKKTVLEGFSRGGLYIYSWALQNPEKVACIYADAPVLDIKSWPGKFYPVGGSNLETWEACKKAFGFKSDEEAKAAKVSPIDKVEQIAKLKIPLLHVCGLADRTVPYIYNTKPFAEKIIQYGGSIKVIEKPGVDHHPHSLKNPQPIVDFIVDAVNKQ